VSDNKRQHILDVADDLIGAFLYYDRKEDEDLEVGEIEAAIIGSDISIGEILEVFERVMRTAVARAAK